MEFIQSLKTSAQQIIELSMQLGMRVQTWNQQDSAPANGYTDRAGFIVYDDIELFADVYAPEDGTENLLRVRLAWSPKGDNAHDIFTIITLDFNTDLKKVKAIIDDANNLTQQMLTSLLNDPATTPKLIHVSLESGRDPEGRTVGKRYEHSAEELQAITEEDQSDFLTTLNKAYEHIVSKI